jgi:lipopolysaccharide biosynthesis regulator YciM
MKSARERLGSEIVKRGYSDDEIAHIYELARFSLENGELRRAEVIANGLVEIAAEFSPAWLILAYVHIYNRAFEAALQAARQAVKCDEQSIAAQLFLAACLLVTGDFNTGGSLLGEIGEKIDNGLIDDPNCIRFYQLQLARFQNRQG